MTIAPHVAVSVAMGGGGATDLGGVTVLGHAGNAASCGQQGYTGSRAGKTDREP